MIPIPMATLVQMPLDVTSMHPRVAYWALTTPLRAFHAQSTLMALTVNWALSSFNETMVSYLNRLILHFFKVAQVADTMAAPLESFIF